MCIQCEGITHLHIFNSLSIFPSIFAKLHKTVETHTHTAAYIRKISDTFDLLKKQ